MKTEYTFSPGDLIAVKDTSAGGPRDVMHIVHPLHGEVGVVVNYAAHNPFQSEDVQYINCLINGSIERVEIKFLIPKDE